MTNTVSGGAAIGLIAAGVVTDIAIIALLIRRSQRVKTAEKRNNVPWPLAALLVFGFGAILIGAGALR